MNPRNSSRSDIEARLPPIYPRLWRYCRVLTGNRSAADDLAQSTVLRALEKSHLFEPGTHLDRWVFTMAQRLWANEKRSTFMRSRGGLVSLEDVDIPDPSPSPETNIMARQVLSQVMALPEAQRITVLLVYVEGFSYQEAATVLDIPIGTVMSRLAAARAKINQAGRQP
jgi:RNA polymerase sigma-70 factor, ECF subfamily